MYELFGNKGNRVEFLGSFHTEEFALTALDEFTGMEYSNVRYIKWAL
ncbi:MAG: hypothetical protein Q4D13_08285 [Erysipelotrichaceae bacterium]|nr:hypothetical protein [Erysipelotrichaceae bacterium]